MNLLLHKDPKVCEQFLDLLGIPAAINLIDAEGLTLFANNALTRKFFEIDPFPEPVRVSRESVAPFLQGVRDPAAVDAFIDRQRQNHQACIEAGRPISTETEMEGPSGVRWARNKLTPLFSDGQVTRVLVTFVDVTELRDMKDELERSLSSLIAGMVPVCHECERIQDGSNWLTMTDYMHRHTDRQFSHGICEDCEKQLDVRRR